MSLDRPRVALRFECSINSGVRLFNISFPDIISTEIFFIVSHGHEIFMAIVGSFLSEIDSELSFGDSLVSV